MNNGKKRSPLAYIGGEFQKGIITNNPVLIQLLGMCSVLAVSSSAENGVGMGLAVTAVLLISNVFISLLRKFIPDKVRIAAYIVVIAGAVSIIELLLKAYLSDLADSLGIFLPLVVVNCIILGRAEAFASKNGIGASLIDALSMGVGYTLALFVLSSIREILGTGKWYGFEIMSGGFQPMSLAISPCGAFIILGFMIGLLNYIRSKAAARKSKSAANS